MNLGQAIPRKNFLYLFLYYCIFVFLYLSLWTRSLLREPWSSNFLQEFSAVENLVNRGTYWNLFIEKVHNYLLDQIEMSHAPDFLYTPQSLPIEFNLKWNPEADESSRSRICFVRISLNLLWPWEIIFKHSCKNCWNLHSRFRLEARDWRKEILVLVAKPEVEIKHKTKRTKVSLSSRMLKYVSRQTLMVTNQHLKESSNIHQKPPSEPKV